MNTLKARNRLVSFRVTDDELECLRVASLVGGSRNVSDFARGAVMRLAETRVHPEEKADLETRLAEVEEAVRRQGDMLRALLRERVKTA
jgi:hypothetical protein